MKQYRHVLLCGLFATTTGCMQYLVQPPQPSLAGSPQEIQVKSYLGSEVQQPPYVLATRCQRGEQLSRVLVRRDFGQGLISWLTLGLIAPATIIYSCANAGDPPLGSSSGSGSGGTSSGGDS